MKNFFHITFSGISTFDQVILLVFTLFFLFRIIYLLLIPGLALLKMKRTSKKQNGESLSLLLTFRNEEENLQRFLPSVLKIKNAEFEIIAVDDFSQDNSLSVLGAMKNENGRLRISTLNQETRFSEKLAQNIALKAANYEWVMVIPPSVSQFGEFWLHHISGLLNEGKDVIINYTNINYSRHFFNRLFRVELFLQQVKSAGFSACGLPFVYTEENVAFRKGRYFESGGYGNMVKEPFANLELIINTFIVKKRNVILFQKETSIQKEESVRKYDYFNLLKKSFRIENFLKGYKRLILFVDDWTKIIFMPLLILVIVLANDFWQIIAVVVVLKLIAQMFIIKMILNHLNERKIFISSLLYELVMPYFKVFYRWHFNLRMRKQRWRSKI